MLDIETARLKMTDLNSHYTGRVDTKVRTVNGVIDVDMEWVSGNEYVIVSNVFLEDVDPKWVKYQGEHLFLNGYIHQYECQLVVEYPELDCKVFRRVSEHVKEGAIW